ncbi:NAD-binding protein [Flammula alnicola]|nr:NAD-binding protein [Flammula alnicola]
MPGVALITGASQGIGRAIAIRLSQDGFRVALNDIPSKKNALEELRDEISSNGKESFVCLADVSVENEVASMITDVVKNMGSLDVIVANAGICVTKPLFETTTEEFHRLYSVNVDGVFFCYKYAASQMIKQGRGGRIIGASSIAGKQGLQNLGAYSSTKFAVRGLTQSAASELSKYGITVNAYAPGAVDTEMLTEIRETITQRGEEQRLVSQSEPIEPNALPSDSTPYHIAALVSYLASKDAETVTGQSISINGGKFYD